ncbi:polysaccharide pyruvyl transferase family protein [Elusimicrobiota bacterium]
MPKIILAGYFGCGNFGDDWILECCLNDLEYLGITRKNVILWPKAFPRLRTMSRESHIIFLGGLWQDKTSMRSLLYYILCANTAHLISANPLIFYGAGIGPITRPISRKLFRRLLKPSSKENKNLSLHLRDENSAKELANITGRALNANARSATGFDLAFGFPVDTARGSERGGDIGIVLNNAISSPQTDDFIANCFQELIRHKKNITIFMTHPARDIAQYKRLESSFRAKHKVISYDNDIHAFIARLSAMDALLSLRLHTSIFAWQRAIPLAVPAIKRCPAQDKIAHMSSYMNAPVTWLKENIDISAWLSSSHDHALPASKNSYKKYNIEYLKNLLA